jgi:hypothetical protein
MAIKTHQSQTEAWYLRIRLNQMITNRVHYILQDVCPDKHCLSHYYIPKADIYCLRGLLDSDVFDDVNFNDYKAMCDRYFEYHLDLMVIDELKSVQQFIEEHHIQISDEQLSYVIAKSLARKIVNREAVTRMGAANKRFAQFVDKQEATTINMMVDINNLDNNEQKELNRLLQKANYYNNIIKEVKADGSNN